MTAERPIVGITSNLDRDSATVSLNYISAVERAGGAPMLLVSVGDRPAEAARAHAQTCDAFVLTGGADIAMEGYGEATHPAARTVRPERQRYEEALLAELAAHHPHKPVLGICLGMQLMSLHAGGRLNQHLPDDTPTAQQHAGNHRHAIRPEEGQPVLSAGTVTSSHHQAVRDPGSLKVLARADDGVIEAVADLERRFYVGVQWHPERTECDPLGQDLFRKLIAAAKTRPER